MILKPHRQIFYPIAAIGFLTLFINCASLKTGNQNKPAKIPTAAQVGAHALPEDIAPIKAPFPMPQLKKPAFQNRSINILERDIKEDVLITAIIQKAIDDINQQGGGTVIIPRGKWLTGRISLKSFVNLHLEEGAELHFSGEIKNYLPAVFTRNEGIELMSLGACIYANGQENIAVTGKGKLIGPPLDSPLRKRFMNVGVIEDVVPLDKPVSERVYEGHNDEFIFLPMFISPINCKNILIEGISLERTPFWNVVPIYCENVIIRGITVNSVGIPRGDGIDIESSKNVLIEYCTLSCGDDCFTMKAGRGEDGLRVNKPTENVVVRFCLAKEGHGGITVGSETAAKINNLYVHDTVFDDTGVGIRFKTRRPRGGGGANYYYERIRMNLRDEAFRWDMLGSPMHVGKLAERLPALPINSLTPSFKNTSAKDIIVENAKAFVRIEGIPETPMQNFRLENAVIKSKRLFTAQDAGNITIKNTTITSEENIIKLLDVNHLKFDKVIFRTPQGEIIKEFSGTKTKNIEFFKTRQEK
ncbi:glycoside hydrolase family 28 [Pseudopedobacter saltans DSM 12145]|uniref:Glycoside hydrolase family 28 n=1 Tax=Pseudopedobacter saltans (strain ATCC 51119 / DSM 12145 / JCM 21818 / CCUG 39354 / LMG 10337 / NBRC 100064 / NCIMB 13643) TaxID=762903 RepID=F0S4E2_PSESL|nr:glycoside hydrolase family 28 protein [Pseudopedobacter saltans]ADY50899.1 glycoside hydrolase family 28 [Pseudopedobacter saltans DSM 12145]